MEILDEQKKQIATELRNYVQNIAGGSQNKASKMLKGVSNAYISHVLKENWNVISDDAWRNLQKQVCKANDWQMVETRPYQFISQLIADARLNANTYGIVGNAGTGKTSTADYIDQENIFVLKAHEYFNQKNFLKELLKIMGEEVTSSQVAGLMQTVIKRLLKLDKPLIIIDEADKLQDKVLYFFISIYNSLEGKCGLIIQATPYLKRRITDGVEKNKKGYQEIYSRIGGQFMVVPRPNRTDVVKICMANGITDDLQATEIFNASDGDLRVVKRLVHAHLKTA